MAHRFSNEEYADMHLFYGQAMGNAAEARRLYQQHFPNRHIPDRKTFERVDRNLREIGSFKDLSRTGRPREVRDNAEGNVLSIVEEVQTTSSRKVANETGVPHTTVWRIFKDQLLHPFKLQKVQALYPADYPNRLRFSQWFLNKQNEINNFVKNILFTDEASFSRDGIINSHNMHIWQDENPHATVARSHQDQFSLNVWCGLINDHMIGPHIFPGRLNGDMYVNFLRNDLPLLMDDVPILSVRNMWFMHDGAPAHYSRNVRQYLHERFPQRWIGRGGHIHWPARSPDLNPLDFFLWGYLKSKIYCSEIENMEDLQYRLTNSCQNLKTNRLLLAKWSRSLTRRSEMCVEVEGQHFEHLL